MYIEERCEDIARHSFQPPIDLSQEKEEMEEEGGKREGKTKEEEQEEEG